MKKSSLLCKLSLLMLALTPACFAGVSNVTATIQDPNGQVFANGNVTATFVPNPNSASATYTSGGVSFAQTVSGTLNGSGTFTIALTDNLTVSPGLSQWNITVCPQASTQCSQYIGTVTGASPNLSSAINATVPVIQVQPNIFTFVFAYADSEIVGPRVGTVYYNTISGQARFYNGTTWAALVGGITSAWASGGVSSGVLCKSNGAGLCLDSSITDNGSTVATPEGILSSLTGTTSNNNIQVGQANTGAFAAGGLGGLGFTRNGTEMLRFGSFSGGWNVTLPGGFGWAASAGSTPDVGFQRLGAQILQLGAAASASPLPNTYQVGETATGASAVGANGTIRAGNGTGSGGGGSLTFQTGVPHGSDSVADTFTTGLSVDKNQLVTAPVNFSSPHVAATTDFTLAGGVAQIGTQGSTGTKIFSCTGSFTSGNFVKTDANGNCVDGGSTVGSVTKEFGTVTAATQSGTAATTYFLNGQTVAAAEFVQGAKFVIESTSKWINNDSTVAKTATFGVGIDGTVRGSCPATSIASGGSTGFATDRLTMTVMTTGAGGTVLISNECASSTASNETSSATTVAFDTTSTHTFTSSIGAPAVDTSSTGTSLILNGFRFN